METLAQGGADEERPPLGQMQTPHHRRQIRYATPEISTQPPAHFILEHAMNHHNHNHDFTHSRTNPHPSTHRSPRTMSASPAPSPARASSSQVQQPVPPLPLIVRDGQDHDRDRMQTDEESEDSNSDIAEDTPEAGSSYATEVEPAPTSLTEEGHGEEQEEEVEEEEDEEEEEEEIMDTSPDHPPSEEFSSDNISHNPQQPAVGIVVDPSTGDGGEMLRQEVIVQVPSSIDNPQEVMNALIAADLSVTREDEARLRAARRHIAARAPDATPEERASILRAGSEANSGERTSMVRAAEREISTVAPVRRIPRTGTGREESERRDRRDGRERDDEGDGGDDSDDSDSEEENPYWANLKEDTSTPDECELKVIEDMAEISALDHDHWVQQFFEPLDDPEYIPSDSARIEWIVKGVHGTPDNPNREKIMRSPSVKIGDFFWNIKYFPHGNDGTEQLSIYIECSTRPHEEVENEEADVKIPREPACPIKSQTPGSDQLNFSAQDQHAVPNGLHTASSAPHSGDVDEGHGQAESTASNRDMEAAPMPATPIQVMAEAFEVGEPWGIAAQIGCVIYNPDEPRVNATQKGCHRFYNDNPDWGWTRFHGPWDEIHKRQRFQRQALLRNDTLYFTAYIRIIKDDTQALWFHPSTDKPEWDSMAMTGVRAFAYRQHSNAVNAAIASWLHLSPIVEVIRKAYIPDPIWEADQRMKPVFEELQDILDDAEEGSGPHEREICLSNLINIMKFYGENVDLKMDIVMIWEALRRVLDFEWSGSHDMDTGTDLFSDVLLLKQPDPFSEDMRLRNTAQHLTNDTDILKASSRSVQGILEMSRDRPQLGLRQWHSYPGQFQKVSQRPSVLQIELPRQSFLKEDRKWKKITTRIEMNEEVDFNGASYSLYGMIVHSGDLESNDYYSVLRPEGPGTRWLKYASEQSPRKIEVLTSKQAVQAHEGSVKTPEETAAVAYLVLYVLKEALPLVLCTPFKRRHKLNGSIDKPHVSSDIQKSASSDTKNPDQEEIPVYVFNSDQFHTYTGRGLCNPWQVQGNDQHVREFKFPSKTTIEEVKKYLTEKNAGAIELWPMNTMALCARAYPGLLSYEHHKGDSIEEMGQHSGGCRFWMTSAEPRPVPDTDTSLIEAQARALLSPDHEEREAMLQNQMRLAEEAFALVNTQTSNPPVIDSDAEMTEAGVTADGAADGEAGQPSVALNDARVAVQTRIDEIQQQLTTQLQLRQAHLDQLSRMQRDQLANIKYTYFLVKVFDPETSVLQGVASKVVKSETRISEEVKKLLNIEPNESWEIYHERGIEIQPKDAVKSSETFEIRCGGVDGSIFVAQRRLTSNQ